MIPDIDLQLQVSIKALVDTIASAVDPSNKMAVEQLGLIIATLTMVRNRLPLQRRLARALLADAVSLVEAIAEPMEDAEDKKLLGDLAQRGKSALADPALDAHDLAVTVRELNAAASGIIDKVQLSPARAAVESIVLQRSATRIQLGRAWCLPAGFEASPQCITAIEELV
jgi:hypothetical protein